MNQENRQSVDWVLIGVPLGLIVLLSAVFFARPEGAAATLQLLRGVVDHYFDSWYCLAGIGCFFVSLYIAFSRYGKIRLGNQEKPTYSSFRWGTMIFTSTMAADILYYSFCEWSLYADDPFLQGLGSMQDWASTYPLFHWGPIAWSFYIILAAAFGFMLHVRGRSRQRMSEACRPLLGSRVDGWAGRLIDLIAVFALLAGTATTFSLSVPLLSSALANILGIEPSAVLAILILVSIAAVYGVAVWIGMKAVSRLALACTWLFFALLAYVFFLGGRSVYILETGICAIGNLAQNFLWMSTRLDPLRQTCFPQNWTIFYWAYWMVWCVATPFFIGQISGGRTIRQLILGGYAWGLAGTWLSFIVLGNYGLSLQTIDGMNLSGLAAGGAGAVKMILTVLGSLPAPKLLMLLLICSMVAFYATTFDALTLVAAGFSCKRLRPDEQPGKRLRVFWAVLLILFPIALLFSQSTMNSLQSVSLLAALPISIVIVLIVVSFFKDARAYLAEKPAQTD